LKGNKRQLFAKIDFAREQHDVAERKMSFFAKERQKPPPWWRLSLSVVAVNDEGSGAAGSKPQLRKGKESKPLGARGAAPSGEANVITYERK